MKIKQKIPIIHVDKIVQRGAISQFPLLATIYRTTVHYQNQEINMGTTHRPYSDFTCFICAPLYAFLCGYMVLCNFITYGDSCNIIIL